LLTSNMASALLAYLAVEAASPSSRESVAAMLWPEQPDRSALAHLRHTLSDLRQALAEDDRIPPFVLASRDTLQLNPAADIDVDVATFAEGVTALADTPHALSLDDQALARLESAVALYRGGFLEGLAVNSVPFEEWALLKREQLHWQAMAALRLLAAAYDAREEYGLAQRYARRQLELQPWQEEAHRQLMRALALGGQRSAALAQYQSCVQRLASELGAAPADETVALYHAIRDGKLAGSEAHARADAARATRLTVPQSRPFRPAIFVSREDELAVLDGFLEMALAGQGRVAFVSGTAGSGKTALLTRFSQHAMSRHPQLVAAGGSCNAHAGTGDPYLPFREILQLLSGEIEAHRAGGSLSPEHARRLWALLPATVQALLTFGPDLVGTFVPGEPLLRRIQAFSPDGMARWARLETLARRAGGTEQAVSSQADLFDQATRVLQAVAAQHPLLLLLDDLQWADKGSLAMLFHLGRRLGDGRILLVGAYRSPTVAMGSPTPSASERDAPQERHPLEPVLHEFGRDWGNIKVDLDQADGRAFVDAFLDTEPNQLDVAFRDTLYQHTGGNPLFTIELLHGLQERGDLVRDEAGHWIQAPYLQWQRLPARVEAVVAERLDRLPTECRSLLQVASVEGEEFTAEVLAHVSGLGLSQVIRLLSESLSKQHRLVRAAHLLRREPGGHYLSCYRFAHILFQRYVYEGLDEVARTHLHSFVANALEALRLEGESGTEADARDPTSPARLARHWEAAGRLDKAAAYLLQAGRRAVHLSAYDEGATLYRHGLVLLEQLPHGPVRAQLEKEILIDLLRPLMASQGWASPERAQLAQKALDLARQQPDQEAELVGALYLHAEVLTAQGRHEECVAIGQMLLQLAQSRGNRAYLALGHYLLGESLSFSGDMAGSVSELRQTLSLYDRPQHAHLLPWTVADLTVACQSLLAVALCFLGYPDQGQQCSQQARTQSRALGQPMTEAIALIFAGCSFHAVRMEAQAAQECGRCLIELSEQKHLPMLRPYGLIFEAWGQTLGTTDSAAIPRIHTWVGDWRRRGHRSGTPFLLALVAQALQHSGDWEGALSSVEEGLALAVEIGGPLRIDLHRIKGELLSERRPPAMDEAEACFHTAIAEARQLGLKLLELRATASLARLWAGLGRRGEARQALSEIYGWFTEGFDTPDLRTARELLNSLT
jgi:DNA-binding SARP family transcriptional activator/tetratricopeptide (TPR) repeat protein